MILYINLNTFLLIIGLWSHGTDKLSCRDDKLWSQEKLIYDDFLGEQDSSLLTLNNNLASALSSTKIEVCFALTENEEIDFLVINKLKRSKSWMLRKSSYILNHEQIHFDISEVFSRKIRQALNGLKKENISDLIRYQDTANNWIKDKREYQLLFDQESNHGLLVSNQNLWRDRVNVELKELEEYSSTSKICSCNDF